VQSFQSVVNVPNEPNMGDREVGVTAARSAFSLRGSLECVVDDLLSAQPLNFNFC